MRIASSLRRLPRGLIYGPPTEDLMTALREGEQVKNTVYLFTNAFVAHFKRGMPEYRGMTADAIALEERGKFTKYVASALRSGLGLSRYDFPTPDSLYYVLSKVLQRHITSGALAPQTRSANTGSTSMSTLKDQLIRLGSANPALRPHIRPVLAALVTKEAASHTFDSFSKEIKRMRLKGEWYQFTGTVDGKEVKLKGTGTWLQIYKVDGVDHSNPMERKVGEFQKDLEAPFK